MRLLLFVDTSWQRVGLRRGLEAAAAHQMQHAQTRLKILSTVSDPRRWLLELQPRSYRSTLPVNMKQFGKPPSWQQSLIKVCSIHQAYTVGDSHAHGSSKYIVGVHMKNRLGIVKDGLGRSVN